MGNGGSNWCEMERFRSLDFPFFFLVCVRRFIADAARTTGDDLMQKRKRLRGLVELLCNRHFVGRI